MDRGDAQAHVALRHPVSACRVVGNRLSCARKRIGGASLATRMGTFAPGSFVVVFFPLPVAAIPHGACASLTHVTPRM
jgi:hypothetical protein